MDQFTCLHYAARDGFVETAEVLIKNGANINCLSSMQRTPLMYATISDHHKMVELLLKHGANVNVKDVEN